MPDAFALASTCSGREDGRRDDLGNVLGTDRHGGGEVLRALAGLLVRDVAGQLGRDRTRLDDDDADARPARARRQRGASRAR